MNEDVINCIFFFLPVKTLLRFRCLSRRHKSLIENPEFANLYSSISRSRRLFLQFHHPLANSDAVAPNEFCPFSHQACPRQAFHGRFSVVGGSCLGLLCLASSPFNICLWNPSTRTHRHITLPDNKHHDADGNGAYRRVSYGLGCDINKEIKLVRLVFSFSPETREFIGEASVYTVRTDTWQTIDFPFKWPANSFEERRMYLPEFGKSGVFVNDGISWMIKHYGTTQNDAEQFEIISLRLNNYAFHTQSLPEFVMVGRNSDSLIDIDMWQSGFFTFYFGGESYEAEIWVEGEEYDNWHKLLIIKGSFRRLKPLFYSTDKKKILLQIDSGLVWYDLQTKRCRNSSALRDGSLLYDAATFVDSPFLLDGLGRCLHP